MLSAVHYGMAGWEVPVCSIADPLPFWIQRCPFRETWDVCVLVGLVAFQAASWTHCPPDSAAGAASSQGPVFFFVYTLRECLQGSVEFHPAHELFFNGADTSIRATMAHLDWAGVSQKCLAGCGQWWQRAGSGSGKTTAERFKNPAVPATTEEGSLDMSGWWWTSLQRTRYAGSKSTGWCLSPALRRVCLDVLRSFFEAELARQSSIDVAESALEDALEVYTFSLVAILWITRRTPSRGWHQRRLGHFFCAPRPESQWHLRTITVDVVWRA